MCETDLTEAEQYVLTALVENPGSPLRDVHGTAVEIDGSPESRLSYLFRMRRQIVD